MNQWAHLLFLGFLVVSGWQDFRHGSVSVWVFFCAAASGILLLMLKKTSIWYISGCIPGLFLYLLVWLTHGEIGEGDAAFFAVGGLFLGFWKTMELLLWGLLLCGVGGSGVILWRKLKGLDGIKLRLPFLPFLILPGIWMTFR